MTGSQRYGASRAKRVLAWLILPVLLAGGAAQARTSVGVGVYFGPGYYYGPAYPRPYYPPGYYYPPYYGPYYPPAVVAVPVAPPEAPQYIERGQVAPAPAPQTMPPGAVTPSEPPYWYRCSQPDGYYPYVQSCPGGWQRVPAQPPPGP